MGRDAHPNPFGNPFGTPQGTSSTLTRQLVLVHTAPLLVAFSLRVQGLKELEEAHPTVTFLCMQALGCQSAVARAP